MRMKTILTVSAAATLILGIGATGQAVRAQQQDSQWSASIGNAVTNAVLRDRRSLADAGLVVVAVVLERDTGRLVGLPDAKPFIIGIEVGRHRSISSKNPGFRPQA